MCSLQDILLPLCLREPVVTNLPLCVWTLQVWRGQLELVERLLEAGADPNVQDTESGWTSLHRALHFGHLRIAAALLGANASLTVTDWQGRTPIDLLSQELAILLPPQGPGDVYSWGNGTNYSLGTGSTGLQESPSRIDSLHNAHIVALAAAKFHSVATTADGELYTWGWGHGGRLGHPEAHIHSGQSAVIAPRLVLGLGRKRVAMVAAAKHHTLLCTTAGETYTMGSNRHGQLGYPAVDTQPTPRRVINIKCRIVAVAAANKHSVGVSSTGDVYTWGSNSLGQLGYGTSDSTWSANPRVVEAIKVRFFLNLKNLCYACKALKCQASFLMLASICTVAGQECRCSSSSQASHCGPHLLWRGLHLGPQGCLSQKGAVCWGEGHADCSWSPIALPSWPQRGGAAHHCLYMCRCSTFLCVDHYWGCLDVAVCRSRAVGAGSERGPGRQDGGTHCSWKVPYCCCY